MGERKVWEEEWILVGVRAGTLITTPNGWIMSGLMAQPENESTCRLASAAPDLVRALLAVEARESQCPVCDAECYWDDNLSNLIKPHTKDCALDAALRKAGVRG